MSAMKVEIMVTRRALDGSLSTAKATVEASGAIHGLGERWMADKMASKALQVLDETYENVAKTVMDEEK